MVESLKKKETDKPKNKPITVFRSGSVKASVWENEFAIEGQKEKGISHSVSIIRSYKVKDTENDWKETNSYTPDSLADLITVADEARKFLKLKNK